MKKIFKALISVSICLLFLVSAVTPALAALGKVKSLTLSAVTPTSATLQWKKVSGAKGYEIQRYQASTWKKVATTKSTKYTVKGLKLGASYKFRVRAYSSSYGAFSSVLSVKTGPANVKGFKAVSKSATQIKLSWNKVSGATGYRIQQYINNKWVTVVKATKNRTATIKNITPGKANKFRITAYKKVGSKNYWGVYSPTLSVTAPKLSRPTALRILSATGTTATISWKKVTGATSYYVYKVNGDTQTRVATVTSNSYTIKNLTPSTDYTFSVRTFLRTNVKDYLSQFSDKLSIRTAPGKVEAFNKPSTSENKINLSWKAVKGAEGYEIWQYDNTTAAWKYVGFSTKTNFTVNNLSSMTTYKFKVRAYHTINGYSLCGAYSNEFSASTSVGSVSNLSFVQATSTSIMLSWDYYNLATSYKLEVKGSGEETKTFVLGQKQNTSIINATVSGLKPGTRYEVSVCAIFPNSQSYAATKTVVTAPDKVEGLRAVPASDGIRLEWAASNGAEMYEISQYTTAAADYKVIATTASTTYFVSGLAVNTAYSFKIRALHKASVLPSYSEYSNVASATISDTPVTPQKPSAPTGVSATNTSSGTSYSIQVTWAAVSGAAGYEVSINNGTWTVLGTTTSTTYGAAGLNASTNYSFRVRAYVTSGSTKVYSEYSSTVSAKTSSGSVTPPTPQKPSAPANVSATNTSSGTSYSIRVSWSAVSGAAGYEVSINNGAWAVLGTTASTSYNATELNASTNYSFRVRAYVNSGSTKIYSDNSSTASAKTSAAPVTPPTPSTDPIPPITPDPTPTLTPSTSKAITGLSVSPDTNGDGYTVSWDNVADSVYHVEFWDPSQSKWQSVSNNKFSPRFSVYLPEGNLNAKYEAAADYVSKVSWSAVSGSTGYEIRNQIVANRGSWTKPITTTSTSSNLRLAPESEQTVRVSATGNVKFRVYALNVANETTQLAFKEYTAKVYIGYDDISFKTPAVGALSSSSPDGLKEAYALMLIQAMNNTRYENGTVTFKETTDLNYAADPNQIDVFSLVPLPKETLEDLTKGMSESQHRETSCTYNDGIGTATIVSSFNNEPATTRTNSSYLFRIFAPDGGNYLYDQHNINSFSNGVKSVTATPGSNGSYTVTVVLKPETVKANTTLKYHPGFCSTIADNPDSLADFGNSASATVGETTITAKINKNYTIDSYKVDSPFSVAFSVSVPLLATVSGTLPGTSISTYTFTR